MTDINVNALSEAINDKMDRDGKNVDTTSGADSVIAYQVPTAENNYRWYRLYASGWVEQGGKIVNNTVDGAITITLPITMADTNYYMRFNPAMATSTGAASNLGAAKASGCFDSQTTTTITVEKQSTQTWAYWEVKGMAASVNQESSSNTSSSIESNSSNSGSGGGTPDPTNPGSGTTK